jgi:hypothetical protein
MKRILIGLSTVDNLLTKNKVTVFFFGNVIGVKG